ncbi:hypothetical protein [Olivibacter domesticus]|uniref:Uncharacterized protein n=1 Tax=Olivibacter domesticus TaxID=407022 RepID=A0A1H7R9U5_OLID1|nr:hypothetical protein [Olivibacter domesticus]SEL57036.1 hypothetical protein SAMN05661044_02903 [Olivibacter domesticus]
MRKPDRNEMTDQEIEAVLVEALKKEPEISLPYGFAAIVTRKVFIQTNLFGIYVKALLLAIGIGALAGIALFLYRPNLMNPLISTLIDMKYVVLFILVVVCLIQYIDQKVVHRHFETT